MIVPEHYIELFKKRDTFGYLASLNNNQFCNVCRSSGIYVIDQEFLKIIYMPALSPHLLKNLQINPQMTVTILSNYTFECYQFKGKYCFHENISDEDERFKDKYLQGMIAVIGEQGFNLDKVLKGKYIKLDVVTIIMKVEEIYEQTPKTGTGNKINLINQVI